MSQSARVADALLVPLVVLLAATLLTSAVSAGFDWLYPLKVVAVGGALWWFRGSYRFGAYRLGPRPSPSG